MNEHTISLSDNLETFAQKIIKEQGYSDINEYISNLIDHDRSKKLSKEPTNLEKLKLFNKKVQRLESSSFINWMVQNPLEIKISNISSNFNNFPSSESIEAFVLTFRLFIQSNDYIGIRNINKAYEQLDLPQELKQEFFNIRDTLNNYLNCKSPITKGVDKDTLNKISKFFAFGKVDDTNKIKTTEMITFSKRDILHFFIYGELAHITQKEDYEEICPNEVFQSFSTLYFYKILYTLTLLLFEIKKVNQKAINYLEK